jgi:hypothetical protein
MSSFFTSQEENSHMNQIPLALLNAPLFDQGQIQLRQSDLGSAFDVPQFPKGNEDAHNNAPVSVASDHSKDNENSDSDRNAPFCIVPEHQLHGNVDAEDRNAYMNVSDVPEHLECSGNLEADRNEPISVGQKFSSFAELFECVENIARNGGFMWVEIQENFQA